MYSFNQSYRANLFVFFPSFFLSPRHQGNPTPRYKEIDVGGGQMMSINSEGLPNKGIDYYIADEAISSGTNNSKPYIVSLSAKNLADNLECFGRAAKKKGVSAVELNLACPNVIGHPIIAYDFNQLEEVLKAFQAHPDIGKVPLGIKLPPYFDGVHWKRACDVINTFDFITFVVSTNTVGNALIVDTEAEQPMIRPNGGHGGLGGAVVKYTSLANVRKLRSLLNDDIDIVGVGGVASGEDAFNLILCGATAVQIGTAHAVEKGAVFERVGNELLSLMKRKGYATIDEFRGKLKEYDSGRASKSRTIAKAKKMEAAAKKDADMVEKYAGTSSGNGSNFAFLMIAALLAVIAVLVSERSMLIKALEEDGKTFTLF
jgi:dihydroorotate dehydrogenase (fumarate)|tara:strand:+ start:221 stop:1339 length:1119 start_codon:yes stop_codon:yes gene_type:complete